jgi:hypothetical protein
MPESENKGPVAKSFRRSLKFVLTAGLLIVVLLVGALFLDLNSFRRPIMDGLSRATGLSIEIESLNLSLSHGLELRCGGLKVRSSDGAREIFAANTLFLDAELEPLLNRELRIQSITLIQPKMKMSLGTVPPASPPAAPPSTGKSAEEPRPESKAVPELLPPSDLMEPVWNILNRPDLSLRAVEIRGGELTLLRSGEGSLPTAGIPVRVDARFNLSRSDSNRVNIKGELSQVEIKNLHLKGTLDVGDALGSLIQINGNLALEPFPLTDLNALAETFAEPGSRIPPELKSGRVEQVFIHVEGLIDPNHNPLEKLVIKSGFQIKDLEIKPPANIFSENIILPRLDGEGIWQNRALNYQVTGALLEGNILSNLVVNLSETLEGDLEGKFNLNTRLNGLNLASARFFKADEWTPTAGITSGSVKVQGSVSGSSLNPVRTDSRLEVRDLVLGLEENSSEAEKASLTVQQKTPERTFAWFQVKNFRSKEIALETIGGSLKVEPEKITLSNGRFIPSNGSIRVSGNYRPRPSTYTIHINGKNLQVEDFLKDQMEGTGRFKGMFQGNLKTALQAQEEGESVTLSHVASGLSGKLSLELTNGGIRILPSLDALLTLLNSTSTDTTQKKGINYDTLGGVFKIWKGRAVTDNFELKGSQVDLATLAAVNLVSGKLNGEVKVMPMQLMDSIVKAVPLLENILTGGGKEGLIETYFKLGGTLEKPKLTLLEGKTLFGKPIGILEELSNTPGENGRARRN